MTENDTIKALGCGKSIECKDCPYRDVEMCLDKVCEDALSIINRQKAEKDEFISDYEKLEKELEFVKADRDFEHQQVEYLRKEKDKLIKTYGECMTDCIKEFARRVKATFPTRDDPHCTDDDIFTLDSIDRIMNDMLTGEKT